MSRLPRCGRMPQIDYKQPFRALSALAWLFISLGIVGRMKLLTIKAKKQVGLIHHRQVTLLVQLDGEQNEMISQQILKDISIMELRCLAFSRKPLRNKD